jgi:hypothetical protein
MDNPFSKIRARIGALKIHGGDFPEGTKLVAQQGEAYLLLPERSDDSGNSPLDSRVYLTKDNVVELSVVSEETVRRLRRGLALGAAGAAVPGFGLVGPFVLGVLVAGKRKDVTFILKLLDGRRLLATTEATNYFKLQAIVF